MRSNVRWKPIRNSQKCHLAKGFVQHSSRDFWVPVIDGGEDGKHNPTYQCVMKMRDHEIRQAKLRSEGGTSQHDAGQAGNQELEEKCDAEQHRHFKLNPSSPHGAEPIKDLDSRRNTDRHRGNREKTVGVGVHSDR